MELVPWKPFRDGWSLRREIDSGRLRQSFRLPVEVHPGKWKAAFKKGLLLIYLPSAEAAPPHHER